MKPNLLRINYFCILTIAICFLSCSNEEQITPSVTIENISISYKNAVINVHVNAHGIDIKEVGVICSDSRNHTVYEENKEYGHDVYTFDISELWPNSKYQIQAFTKDYGGNIFHSDALSIETKYGEYPTISNFNFTDVNSDEITFIYSIPSVTPEINKATLVISENEEMKDAQEFECDVNEHTILVKNLNPGVLYYCCLKVQNDVGTSTSKLKIETKTKHGKWNLIMGNVFPNSIMTFCVECDNKIFFGSRNDPTAFYIYDEQNGITTIPGFGNNISNGLDYNAFSIGDCVYILGYSNEVWCYDMSSAQWIKKNKFPGGARSQTYAHSCNGKGYYSYGSSNIRDIWEYDPESDQWKCIWIPNSTWPYSYPDDIWFNRGISFCINNELYFCQTCGTAEFINDLWAFNVETRTWKKKNRYPGNADSDPVVFTIGDKAYVTCGMDNNATWEYSSLYDEWTKKADYPYASHRFWAGATSLNGIGYIWGGNYRSFDVCVDVVTFNPKEE